MAIAASINKKIQVSTDGNNWRDLNCDSASLDSPTEFAESTPLGAGGYMTQIPTKRSWSISAEVFTDEDNTGYGVISTAALAKTLIHVQYLTTGADDVGFKGQAYVSSMNSTGGIGDIEKGSFSFTGDGVLTKLS